jgi:hypothetical protein
MNTDEIPSALVFIRVDPCHPWLKNSVSPTFRVFRGHLSSPRLDVEKHHPHV